MSDLKEKSRSNLKNRSRASRSQLQMKSGHSRLYSQSRSRLSGAHADDESEWLTAKDPVKPENQLELSEEELKAEFTRILRADNPNAPDNIVRFSHKDGVYKQIASVEQSEIHFSHAITMIHVDSDEARRQLAKSKFAKKKPQMKESGTGTDGDDTATGEGDGAEKTEDEGTGDDAEAAEEGDAAEGEDDGDAAAETAEDEEEEDAAEGDAAEGNGNAKPLRNQFNFSERASQTQGRAFRDRGTVTEAPARENLSGLVTQWIIYDAYMADQERQKALKENNAKKRTVTKEKKKVIIMPGRDLTEDQGSDWQLAANVISLPIAKKMERLVNQNTFHEVQMDFKYWDDPSDQFKEKEGTVLPLWRMTTEAAKKKTNTCLQWSPSFSDMFYATFGSYDYSKQGKGAFAAYSLKNPSFPEVTFELPTGAMCFDILPTQTSLVVIGFYDGSVAIYDISRSENRDEPIVKSTASTGKHTDPVWQVKWHADDVNHNHNFSSVSSDGRVATWTLVKTELQHIDIVRLSLDQSSASDASSTDALFGLGSGTCIAFNDEKPNMFLIGTEEGDIHQCSKAYSSKFLKSFKAHTMSVYEVVWNRFHPRVFASCSADWTVKIWDELDDEPIFSFDLGNAVGDVAWSPYSPCVFAAVTTDGKIHVFDLSQNKYEPMCVQQILKKGKPTHLSFNPTSPTIVVGDTRGACSIFKLSPNLRKLYDEKKKKSKEQLIVMMDKLLASVKETPHVPAVDEAATQ